MKALLLISTIAAIGLIMANMLVFYLFEYQIKTAETKKREHLLNRQLKHTVEYYRKLSPEVQELIQQIIKKHNVS